MIKFKLFIALFTLFFIINLYPKLFAQMIEHGQIPEVLTVHIDGGPGVAEYDLETKGCYVGGEWRWRYWGKYYKTANPNTDVATSRFFFKEDGGTTFALKKVYLWHDEFPPGDPGHFNYSGTCTCVKGTILKLYVDTQIIGNPNFYAYDINAEAISGNPPPDVDRLP